MTDDTRTVIRDHQHAFGVIFGGINHDELSFRPCRCGHYPVVAPLVTRRGAIETEAAQPAPGLDAADLETLEKALAIGFISWDGDDWYASDRGYIDADETFAAAQAIVARLRGGER